MYLFNIIFCILTLFNFKAANAASKFNEKFNCKVVGSSPIFKNGEFNIKTYNKEFINTKIPDTSQYHDFRIDKCECYAGSGGCRLALSSKEGGKNLRLILVLGLKNKDLTKNNVSFKDIFQAAEKKGKIKSRAYCKVKNELYFSSIYAYENSSKKKKEGNVPGFDKTKDMIRTNYVFPIFYKAEANYGEHMDGKNGKEVLLTAVNSYQIVQVVECVSKYSDFSSYSIRRTYDRSGYKNTAVACNWNL